MKKNRLLKRRLIGFVGWSSCFAAFLAILIPLGDIIFVVLGKGFSAFHWSLLTTVTNGTAGGLANAIYGTFVLSVGALIIGVPIGVGAGIYLSEYGKKGQSGVIRFFADVLVGVPSIVLGYFSYITMVIWLGWQFSVLAGAITLAVMILPYLARISEMAFRQAPQELREAAFALGAGEGKVVFRILFPVAKPAVLTGILLSLAIAVGETAPLIYTAGWSNQIWKGHLTHEPVAYLTYVIWTFIDQPFASAHALAFAAAALVMLFVLVINVAIRLGLSRK